MGRVRKAISVAAVSCLLLQGVGAGQLDDFEEKAEKREKVQEASTSSSDRTRSYAETSAFGSGTYPSDSGGSSFLGSFAAWLISSPFESRHDDPAGSDLTFEDGSAREWADDPGGWNHGHQSGSAILPYVRADYNRQYIDSNLYADDVRLEAGYRVLAFHGRHTRYVESNPTDDLTINQFYGVLRVGGSRSRSAMPMAGWEVGLGLGAAQQVGNEEHSSGALTIPVKFYPAEWVGLEFRPAWYRPQEKTISDYDISISAGARFLHLRAGYRWLWLQGDGHWLNGPYAGMTLSF